jgi:glutaredoxin
MNTKITIYTLPVCPNCRILKETLKENNIDFVERDLDTPDIKTKLLVAGVFTAIAPIIEINGKYLTFDTIFQGDDVNMVAITGLLKGIIDDG